jgi:hypothetical protein
MKSGEPPNRIRECIQTGERMCYTLRSLAGEIQLLTHISLNGEELSLEEPDA